MVPRLALTTILFVLSLVAFVADARQNAKREHSRGIATLVTTRK